MAWNSHWRAPAASLPVVVINLRQVRDFAKATGRLAKPMRWPTKRYFVQSQKERR